MHHACRADLTVPLGIMLFQLHGIGGERRLRHSLK
jgi:hypothetical protein